MAADDQQEKSLFTRIKDCVLTELNRKRDELPRSPCPSGSKWGWTMGRESIDSESRRAEKSTEDKSATEKSKEDKSLAEKGEVEGLRKGHCSSDEPGTTGAEENASKLDSAVSENRSNICQEDKDDRASAEANNSAAEPNLAKRDKFEPRRYYIKMQNPEAPPCCESLISSKISPPKTRKPMIFDQDCEKYRRKPVEHTHHCG